MSKERFSPHHVFHAESSSPPIEEKPEKQKTPEQIEAYRECQAFIEQNRDQFDSWSGDTTLTYVPCDSGFSIAVRTGEVRIGVDDFITAKKFPNFPKKTILWSTLHELGHYRDMKKDPKGMLAQFEYADKRGKELAPKAQAILKKRFPNLPSYVTDEMLTRFISRRISRFINCLEDIHVNWEEGRHFAQFRYEPDDKSGTDSGAVNTLYRDFLFATDEYGVPPTTTGGMMDAVNYADFSLSSQLGDQLLRKYMVPDQMINVSDGVQSILLSEVERRKKTDGTYRTFQEVVQFIANPRSKYSTINNTATWRLNQYDADIMPQFLQLLMKDFETLELPPPQEKGEGKPGQGQGEPGLEEPQPSNKGKSGEGKSKPGEWDNAGNVSMPFTKKDVKEFVKEQEKKEAEEKKKKEDERKKKKMTPEQRSDKALKETLRKIAGGDTRITDETIRDYVEMRRSIESYKQELAEVFKEFLQNVRLTPSSREEGYFTSGKMDVNQLIKRYGPFLDKETQHRLPVNNLEVYTKREYTELYSIFPSRIQMRFIADTSGSMFDSGDYRYVQQTYVLIMEAMKTFEEMINLNFQLTKKFQVDTQVIVFGDSEKTEIVKDFGTQTYTEELRLRLLGFQAMAENRGSTDDSKPWRYIADSVTEKDIDAIKNGELIDVAFEITDGGSDDVQATFNGVYESIGKQIEAYAIQVGDGVSEKDENSFNTVWNDNFVEPHGKRLKNIKELPELMKGMLANLIETLKTNARLIIEENE